MQAKCFLGRIVARLLLAKIRRRARGVVTRPMKRENNTSGPVPVDTARRINKDAAVFGAIMAS